MTSSYRLSVYDRFLNYLVEKATPDAILTFSATDEEQKYADDLIDHLSAGTLTADEKTDLESLHEIDEWISLLKARALNFDSRQQQINSNVSPPNVTDIDWRARMLRELLVEATFELRTPLNGIKSFAEILGSTANLNDEERHLLDQIIASANHSLKAVYRAGNALRELDITK